MDCRGDQQTEEKEKSLQRKDLRDRQRSGLYWEGQKLWLDDQGLGNIKVGDLRTGTLKKRYVDGPFD